LMGVRSSPGPAPFFVPPAQERLTTRADLSERALRFFIFYGSISYIYAAEKSGGRLFSGPCLAAALAYFNRGVVYYEKGNKEQTIADFRKALEINPSDQDAKVTLELLGVTP